MKISFDFDGVLTDPKLTVLAKQFIDLGADVWIVTRRSPIWNNEHLKQVQLHLGIPDSRVLFTDLDFKAGYLLDFDLHIDDDQNDIDLINTPVSNCLALKYTSN